MFRKFVYSGEGRGGSFGALFATDTHDKANLAVCLVQFRRAGWQRQGYSAQTTRCGGEMPFEFLSGAHPVMTFQIMWLV